MARLEAFLPHHLRRLLARGTPPAPAAGRFEAALLFSDISGFTALSERLQIGGREGAGEIATVVDRAFRPAIRTIEEQRGSIVSFGGDALFSIFVGVARVERAEAAAAAIGRLFVRRGRIKTSAGSVELGVSQAIHHGAVTGAHLGDERSRHYLLTGPSVMAVARHEGKARAGTILVSPAARRAREGGRRSASARPAPQPVRIERAVASLYLPRALWPVLGRFHGEYRQATVLFLESRGSRLSRLQQLFRAVESANEAYGGVLLKTDLSPVGTKWLLVFGIPRAHGDDAARAARAALEIMAHAGAGAELRGGMHAGVVANLEVGTSTRRSFDVMGDAVNTAARALARAAWGEVLSTVSTVRLCPELVTVARGIHAVKGKVASLELAALVRTERAMISSGVDGPLVGRHAEMAVLMEGIEAAREGRGTVLAIGGEPGIGKTRLAVGAAQRARRLGVTVHVGRAHAFGAPSYEAIADLLRGVIGVGESASPQERSAALSDWCRGTVLESVDRQHIEAMLGASVDGYDLDHLEGADVRLNIHIALVRLLSALTRSQPALVVLEDLQWAHAATCEAVAWIAASIADLPLLLLLLHRPGYVAPPGARTLELVELDPGDVRELVAKRLGDVPEAVRRAILERSGGNPFFVEELVAHLIETGLLARNRSGVGGSLRADELPPTVEAVVRARLDAVAHQARRTAQAASVIGRSFVRATLDRVATPRRGALEELCDHEIVLERSREPSAEYQFKHALTRDVAYGSLLASRRRRLHRAAARAIEAQVEGRDAVLPLLGHHWEQAGDPLRAKQSYLPAARHAASLHANEEAAELYHRFLALQEAPDATSVRVTTELGRVLKLTGRVGEAEELLRQAHAAAGTLGDAAAQLEVMIALVILLRHTGRPAESGAMLKAASLLTSSVNRPDLHAALLTATAANAVLTGKRAEARKLYSEVMALAASHGLHARVVEALVERSASELRLGLVAEARTGLEEAVKLARRIGDPATEGIALSKLGALHAEIGSLPESEAALRAALPLIRQVGNRRSEAVVLGNLGTAAALRGDMVAAGQLFELALSIYQMIAAREGVALMLGNLASVRLNVGDLEGSAHLLERAAEASRASGEEGDHAIWNCVHGSIETLRGDWSRAEALHGAAHEVLERLGFRFHLGVNACLIGHLRLATGFDAEAQLEMARATGRDLGVTPQSELGSALARLDRAAQAAARGEPLVRGYAPDDVPEPVRAWLRDNQPDALG